MIHLIENHVSGNLGDSNYIIENAIRFVRELQKEPIREYE